MRTLALLLAAACATPTTLQSSRTLGHGGWRVLGTGAVDGAFGEAGLTAYPTTDLRVDAGVSDRVDLGLASGGHGVGPTSKVQLWARPDQGPAAALAPSIVGAWSTASSVDSGYTALELPLVLG